VAPLTPADVKHWDPDSIHSVFQTATNRAATLQTLGDNLQQVHNKLSDWQGDAGDAFRADLGKARRDIEADGHESKQVAAAVSRAESDVRSVKSELDGIEQAAEGDGFAITSDWRIDSGAMKLDSSKSAAKQQLQGQLDTCKLHAHNADEELATAIRSAVGEAPVGAGVPVPGAPAPGAPAPGAPKSPAPGQPKSLEDMLLPAGPASAQPGGDPAKGPPVPAGAAAGKPPSLEDMLLGRGQPADPDGKPPAGSLPDLLSRVRPPGAPGGAPAPQLKPSDIETFKSLARQSMLADGVPPDQIEARLNDAVTRTQQWMDNGMPNYVPPEPPRPPPPGFGDGFADRWFSTEQGIHDLTGQNGLGALGDSWGGMAKGLAGKAEEFLTQGPVAPINDLTHEFKSFVDNPAYYAGGKTADGAFALPGMMFGPEGAGLGELSELDAAAGVAHDLPGVHPPIGPIGEGVPGLHAPPEVPGGLHPSGPVEGPLPSGHVPSAPAAAPAPVGHVPSAPAEAPAVHPSGPAEAPAPVGHVPTGPAEAPAPVGHHPTGPAEGPASVGHEPPPSGGHPPSGPFDHPPPSAVEHVPPHDVPPESQWVPVGHDQPITYHPEAPQAALDLSDAFAHGHPTADLSQRVADMSTHYVGDNPDRVVLGKWAGDESGYIGEARGRGGIYYDTSSEVWNNIGHGLSKTDANDLGWEVNEHFLRTQMENGIGRIDYVVEGTNFSSVEDVLLRDPDSFSAKEIRYLTENASSYGYERVGNSWIRVKGSGP
jgi:uncharacterized protein YukE